MALAPAPTPNTYSTDDQGFWNKYERAGFAAAAEAAAATASSVAPKPSLAPAPTPNTYSTDDQRFWNKYEIAGAMHQQSVFDEWAAYQQPAAFGEIAGAAAAIEKPAVAASAAVAAEGKKKPSPRKYAPDESPCAHCKQPTKHLNQPPEDCYCSMMCYLRAHPVMKTCAMCNKEFKFVGDALEDEEVFCSYACQTGT